MEDLDKQSLIRILKEPKNSIVKQYKKLFKLDDVELEFTDKAFDVIAEKTLKRKTGARGLKSIVEDLLLDIMFEVPSNNEIKKIIIDVDENNELKIIKE